LTAAVMRREQDEHAQTETADGHYEWQLHRRIADAVFVPRRLRQVDNRENRMLEYATVITEE
jgi:hypothetical protein